MAWSPKRDLIALANRAGEVSAARGGGQPAVPAVGRGEGSAALPAGPAGRTDGGSSAGCGVVLFESPCVQERQRFIELSNACHSLQF